jgi:hypothetical protein
MIRSWGASTTIWLYAVACAEISGWQTLDTSLRSDSQPFGPPSASTISIPLQQSPNTLGGTDSCTPEKVVVWPSETIQLQLWNAPSEAASQFSWKVTAGHIEGQGENVRWDFNGVSPGYYTATVTYAVASRVVSCSIQVVVEERPGARGTGRDTGHALLVKDTNERPGYGLYSYLLLAAPPDDATRDRYLKLMESFLQQVPAIEDLEKYFDRKQLNITYVPVTESSTAALSAQWLLDHYDYARARFLLHALDGDHSQGPYIVSSLQPLGKGSTAPYLSQNFSYVPPRLVPMWVAVFMNQAAQEHFWEASSVTKMVPTLRTAVAILAEGLPDVRRGLDEWVKLAH